MYFPSAQPFFFLVEQQKLFSVKGWITYVTPDSTKSLRCGWGRGREEVGSRVLPKASLSAGLASLTSPSTNTVIHTQFVSLRLSCFL